VYIAYSSYYPFIRQFIWFIQQCIFPIRRFIRLSSVLSVYDASHPVYASIRHSSRFIRRCILPMCGFIRQPDILSGLCDFVLGLSVVLFVYRGFYPNYPCMRHSISFIRLCILPMRCTIDLSGIFFGLSIHSTFYQVYPSLLHFSRFIRRCILSIRRTICLSGIVFSLSVSDILSGLSSVAYCPFVLLFVYSMMFFWSIRLSDILAGLFMNAYCLCVVLSDSPALYLVYPALHIAHSFYYPSIRNFFSLLDCPAI